MIEKSLPITKAATFSVHLPDPKKQNMPVPFGTGFFISSDGWFVTAAHVITEDNNSNGPIRKDIGQAVLMKESEAGQTPRMCTALKVEKVIPELDFVLLKIDFEVNKNKAWLNNSQGFPFLQVSSIELNEGEAVYAFGYPLPESFYERVNGTLSVGFNSLCPRTTSAIVSSKIEKTQMLTVKETPRVYVLDKALNYGNSGGPIVSVGTGHVHAFCSRYQPVYIKQPHLRNNNQDFFIGIPSLYGIVVNLGYSAIIGLLQSLAIKVAV